MATTNLYFFECQVKQYHRGNSGINILMSWGLVLALLFTMMSFALIQSEELFDYEDVSFIGGEVLPWILKYFFSGPLLAGLELEVLITIMCLEYLRGHIGEKRLPDQAVHLNNSSLFARFFPTALFYSAVFSYFFRFIYDNGNSLVTVFRSTWIS